MKKIKYLTLLWLTIFGVVGCYTTSFVFYVMKMFSIHVDLLYSYEVKAEAFATVGTCLVVVLWFIVINIDEWTRDK